MGGLYDYRWQKRRARQLRDEPLCRICAALGRVVVAVVADHVVPHRGDPALFEGELQSLCKLCHDSVKQQQEKSGRVGGCDVDGRPLDRSHWWNR
jgi:5-methylcytosine-specific restriction endonuclease McrA